MTRRAALALGGGAVGFALGQRWNPGLAQTEGVALASGASGPLILDDASELSATPIAAHSRPQAHGDALVQVFRDELAAARAEGRPVNVGAARHSMGGQAIPREGRAITVEDGWIEADTQSGVYRVNGGARWSQVIAALDPLGFGPKVMQSNNDFGVAATFSVNAHGWAVPFGPMGATVRALRMVLPDGSLVTASRQENPDLFALAMGGYGLVGLIVDLEVEMVPNRRLAPRYEAMAAEEFAQAFVAAVEDPGVAMAYGRLNVDRRDFFGEALLVTLTPTEDQSDLPPAAGSGAVSHIAAEVYRAQVGRETAKRFRWWIERDVGPAVSGPSTWNSYLNEPVATLADGDPSRVDILHEYFVPPAAFGDFLIACREVIPDAFTEFLNVTLRYVAADPVSLLAHSPDPRIAAVMSFSQEKSARGEADHARLTRRLIDRVLEIGGSYYLPYRPHATPGQFRRAYPRAAEFAEAKRALDPSLTLRNNLWDSYLEAL